MEAQVQDPSVLDQIRAFIDQVLIWLETITGVFADIDGMLENVLSIVENSEGIIQGIFNIGTFIVDNIGAIMLGLLLIVECLAAILGTIISVGGLIAVIVGGIVSFVIWLACYLFSAFPYYKLGKKAGVKLAWLAWVPIPGVDYYCRLYVLSQIPGEKPVSILGDKLTIPNRYLMFWICMAIRFIGPTVITGIVLASAFIAGYIPLVGQALVVCESALYLIPTALVVFLEFAFLYDTLCTFKEKKLPNMIFAIILTLIDNVFTFNLPTTGIATTVFLYTLLKCQPLNTPPQETDDPAPPEQEETPALPSAEVPALQETNA